MYISLCTSLFWVVSVSLNLVVNLFQFEKVPAQLNNSIVNSSFQESSIHNGVSSSHPSPSIPVQVSIQTRFYFPQSCDLKGKCPFLKYQKVLSTRQTGITITRQYRPRPRPYHARPNLTGGNGGTLTKWPPPPPPRRQIRPSWEGVGSLG